MATLSTFEILSIYKSNTLKFLDSIIELFPEESDIIVMRILFENQIPIDTSMKVFSKRLFTPVETDNGVIVPADMIKIKNDKFFLHNSILFSGVEETKIIRWKQLWQSKRLDSSDREAIWKWFKLFRELSEMYIANEKLRLE